MNTLGERIKELRKEKGLTQEHLAQKLSFNRATLASWEVGRSLPDIDTLTKLAEFFGVSIDFLLDRTTIPHVMSREEVVLQDGKAIKPEYISEECAIEAAKIIERAGKILNQEEKKFLLNMIKTYSASEGNERGKGDVGK